LRARWRARRGCRSSASQVRTLSKCSWELGRLEYAICSAKRRKHAPSIVFIDELDALGKARGMNVLSSHDEREQTLNQLLAEMDGFDPNQNVIIMAATNRPEILDAALLRPGRFDRQVLVDRPDVKGREKILQLHAKKVKLSATVDLGVIAVAEDGGSILEHNGNPGSRRCRGQRLWRID